MHHPLLLPLAAVLLLAAEPLSATPARVRSSPSPIVLGEVREVVLEVNGLPGSGAVAADVNVGQITSLSVLDDRIRLRYRTPAERFPQRLCLLLRRGPPGLQALAVRLPLLAYATVPVRTRRNAQVTLTIGDKVFGPHKSDRRGRVQIRVLVPPGIEEGTAEAIDDKGMETRKQVAIHARTYNLLALTVASETAATSTPASRPALQIRVAAAEEVEKIPVVELTRPETPPVPIPLAEDGEEQWKARFVPGPELEGGRWTITARIPGSPSSRAATIMIPHLRKEAARKVPDEGARESVHPRAPGFWDRLRWNLSLAAGLQHNLGEIKSPRITGEGGADYPLGPGRIGLRLSAGVSWSSQEILVTDGLASSSADVVLVPFGVLLAYGLPLGRVTPYLAAGMVIQLVRTRTEGEHTGRLLRSDVALGGVALLGARLGLGPGGIFLQAGYQHSRIENQDVELRAGGLLLEAGYRLEL